MTMDEAALPQLAEAGLEAPRGQARTRPAKAARRIQSVDRALTIMETLALSRGGMSLQTLSAETGLNASTCHHLLMTLAHRGYVSQDRRTKEYALGNKIIELSEARVRQIDIVRLVMPVLARLNEDTGEAVHLAAMQGRELVTLAKLDSRHAVKVDSAGIGKSGAAHATGIGKAILAWLPEDEIRAILAASGMKAYTEKTIRSVDELIGQFALVRRHGFALDREEFQPGVTCVGTAIRDHSGAVVASLGVSIPTMRAVEGTLDEIKERVKAAAAEASRELGSRPRG